MLAWTRTCHASCSWCCEKHKSLPQFTRQSYNIGCNASLRCMSTPRSTHISANYGATHNCRARLLTRHGFYYCYSLQMNRIWKTILNSDTSIECVCVWRRSFHRPFTSKRTSQSFCASVVARRIRYFHLGISHECPPLHSVHSCNYPSFASGVAFSSIRASHENGHNVNASRVYPVAARHRSPFHPRWSTRSAVVRQMRTSPATIRSHPNQILCYAGGLWALANRNAFQLVASSRSIRHGRGFVTASRTAYITYFYDDPKAV